MYWPVGTPRIYATSSSRPPQHNGGDDDATPFSLVVSDDGAAAAHRRHSRVGSTGSSISGIATQGGVLARTSASGLSLTSLEATDQQPGGGAGDTSQVPPTPLTPAVKSVEHHGDEHHDSAAVSGSEDEDSDGGQRPARPRRASAATIPDSIPSAEPILALRLSRRGDIFATITATSMTVWQTKPTVILATVVRSASSLAKYGPNASLLLRPDAAIFVVHTTLGFLITYSLATDPHSHVYVPHFVGSSANISRRRQSHAGAGWIGVVGPSSSLDTSGGGTVGISPGEELMLGPGEGAGARDASVRFRMVIKVDAGIGAALALDDELVVATHRPAAVQCIRWTPDSKGGQTSTELLGRMTWMQQNDSQGAGAGAASQARKKVAITEMTHDRPMNLATWVTTDGRAYAVQRIPPPRDTDEKEGEAGDAAVAEDKPHQAPRPPPEQKKRPLFRGHCFHVPSGNDGDAGDAAVRATVNARFSLIAVGCVDGCVRVYTARDYAGNIAPSHMHRLPDGVSRTRSGRLTCLAYSPDGHCLFAGYEKGWATWSVYGKPGAHAFAGEASVAEAKGETWLEGGGVREAVWIGGGCELLVVGGRSDALWVMEMARSSVTGCYGPANLFRTILHTSTDIMVYRGYDLPDLSSISAEPFLWHTAGIPPGYLLRQWPVRCVAVSPDGRYVAVAGRRGLVHYSVASGRWKTFGSEVALENEFQVRGGMTWYQHILVAAVETTAAVASPTDGSTHMVRVHELRLFSRETALDSGIVMYAHRLPSPVVLLAPSGEDALLVYTHDNILRHFRVVPVVLRGTGARAGNGGGAMRLVEVGRVGLHDVVRSPPRVRGLSWLVPDGQLLEGDPAMDAATASALFLVDGKLVLLRPTVDETAVDPDAAEGSTGFVKVRYDMRHMRVVAHNVEFHVCMRDLPLALVQQLQLRLLQDDDDRASVGAGAGAPAASVGSGALGNSLWIFDGNDVKMWPDVHLLLNAAAADGPSRELPPVVTVPIDFYPLSVLLGKGTVLGLEPDLVQRRDINFSYFRFTIRTHLFLPEILRFHLSRKDGGSALVLGRQYRQLEYFAHALEVLLHQVLDEEVDSSPAPEAALLPRVLGLLSSFPCYLDVVVRCTRKTELRSWRTLFDYLPPPQELFEESLQRGSLKTAGGYLLVLHTFDDYEHGGHGGSSNGNGSDLATAMDQSVRLLARAMAEGDWELCKELARFLAALDESGNTLRSVMQMLHLPGNGGDSGAAKREDIATRLAMPPPRQQGRVNGAVAGAADGSNRATTQLPGGDEESTPSEGSAPHS